MNITMKDRVAVVTGGSKGIGIAVARQICRVRRQGRDRRAWRAGPEGGARAACQGWTRSSRLCLRRVQGFGHFQRLREDRQRSRQDRRPRQQCRHLACDGVRDHQRRGLAGRSRSETVRCDPFQPAGLAGHEGAQMGPHHQRAQYRRQGSRRRLDADLGVAGGRHGADQGRWRTKAASTTSWSMRCWSA